LSIEAWVTDPAGSADSIVVLDRSKASPFRRFGVSRMRGADPGGGSLEYHLDNALVAATPGLLDDGNLVWMRYRGRTLVWVIEEHKAVLDQGEHETDWIRVAGRGSKQLLADRTAWPTAFAETGVGLDPSKWGQDNQWRRFVNRAAGEMLWDLISESNGRPGFAPITRGMIETTGADGWTQDLRFDNLLDVVADVTNAYGEIELDGLEFNYWNAMGVDRTDSVILEEGADLLRVERMTSDRDTITWAVAEGVGEGVTAKLAVAKDVTATRRREAYVDAKDAGNVPLVQLRADATISELRKADSIALEVTEERFAALVDYDIWDTVRVIAPSRSIDATAVIVAMYLAEDDDERVRVGIDVNTPRQEALLRLEEGNRSVRRSVDVRNRMPQGNMMPIPIAAQGILDSGSPMYAYLKLTDRAYLVIEAKVSLAFRQFLAPATAAASSGTLTSISGGGSTSGASSATSTASNSNSGVQMESNATHSHAGGAAAQGVSTPTNGSALIVTLTGHTHDIPHTHATPAHQHDINGHTHALTYGTFEETFPASHSVTLRVYERVGAAWTLRGTLAGLTADLVDVDLTAVIDGPGDWRLTVQSEAAQPNGGRLGCDLYGLVWVAVQSA
jgi:hypothetical protein